ncbi:type I-C CRISPR-associated protein Cas5c [Marasmitruncus massiliensis]|uniref:type I-C CRISPR-associated protein Cas5c n=1 Tax=Marasmitruncus massiliensis TaxID=1944642 RepID=UPI000C7AE86B|nr:type I-C CRISPR-associated protein Cas5c [Marasmitruncus massiliensis]
MGYGIKILIEGDYALFSRPEMKVERVSYDVPTPSALAGLLSSIYWHPGVRYLIDRIHVLEPIRFVNIRRNEVSEKLLLSAVKKQMDGSKGDVGIYTKECISQRASLLLKDVRYGVEAHFELTDEKDAGTTPEKCYNILLRRLRKGQHFTQPCLGCREFSARVTLAEQIPQSPLAGDVDLGYMLYDLQYKKNAAGKSLDSAEPRFYRPHMVDGVIDVAKYAEDVLC